MRPLGGRERGVIALTAGLVASCLVAAPAAGAIATERVKDPSFDTGEECNATECVDLFWAQSSSTAMGTVIGPLCSPTVANCSPNSGYNTQFGWARLGAATEAPDSEADIVDSSISEPITIPASFPPDALATLHFNLRIRPSDTQSDESMTVSLNDTPVLDVEDTDNRYTGTYQSVSVPLDGYVGPGTKTLKFEASGTFRHISTSFDVDDVSVTAPDSAAVPNPPASQPTMSPPATKRCKKKKHRSASASKKRCKKKH
jgi:hypothetical protein